MTNIELTLLVMLALLVLYIGIIFGLAFRNDRLSKRAVQRLESDPGALERAELLDEDAVRLVLTFKGEKPVHMGTVRGVAAVRLYDRLPAIAPQAHRQITRGGMEVSL